MPTIAQILKENGREGWYVSGKGRQATEKKPANPDVFNSPLIDVPIPGQWVLPISSGKPGSQPDEITVATKDATAGGVGDTEGPGWDLIEGPKHQVQGGDQKTPDWAGQYWRTIDNSGTQERWGTNPATGQAERMTGPDGKPIINVAKAAAASTTAPHVEGQPRQLPDGTWVEDQVQWDPTANGGKGMYVPAPGLAPKPIKDPRGEPAKKPSPTFQTIQGTTYAVIPDTSPQGFHLELPSTPPGANKEPYDDIVNGIQVHMVWVEGEGKYKPDPTVAPVPWSPQAKADAAKAAAQPVEGKTRTSIDKTTGREITETYSGGDWVPTSIGGRKVPLDPKQVTPSTDTEFIVTTDENGQPTFSRNQNYQGPKPATTRGELAQRVAFLQSQAAQMVEKIRADKTVPSDQQSARFNQWYDQNIAPQIDALGQQQQSVIRDEALKNADAQRQAFAATAQYRAPAGYGRAFEQGLSKLAPGIDWSGSTTWKGPDLTASIPAVPEGMDFGTLLGRGQWAPPGAAGPPPPSGGPPPEGPPGAPGPAPAPAALTPEQIANRAAASTQTAAATALGGGGVNGTGAPVGANPLAYAMLRQRLDDDAALQARQAGVPQPFQQPVPAAPAAPLAPAAPPMPHATALQPATGGGPLAYGGNMFATPPPVVPSSPGLVDDAARPFAGLIPYLPTGYDPRYQTNYAWPHLTP